MNKQLLDQKDEINLLLREKKVSTTYQCSTEIKIVKILEALSQQLSSLPLFFKDSLAADAEERRSDYFSIDGEDISLVSQTSGRSSQGSFKCRRGSRLSDYLFPGCASKNESDLSSLISAHSTACFRHVQIRRTFM